MASRDTANSGGKSGRVPIVPHFEPQPTSSELAQVDHLAAQLLDENPELHSDERIQSVSIHHWEEGPALHLDDLTAIRSPSGKMNIDYLQDRARLRAADGDFIATACPSPDGFTEYFRDRLRLGSPTWLTPECGEHSLAMACWHDRRVRRRLLAAIRGERLAFLHPHMGNPLVWELALQLQQAARKPVRVIGAPPAVSAWANDKLAFSRTVARLLGPSFVPRSRKACNLATLSQVASDFSERTQRLVIKAPESAGGLGNYVVECDRLRGRSLTGVRRILKRLLRNLHWEETTEVLVGCWETDVLAAPSAQLWLPPLADGPPIVEGLFVQDIEGAGGTFAGTRPAEYDSQLTTDMAHWSWLLGLLFQRLGYVGRCSFDMLLVGQSLSKCRVKFIECNGRWGGTSLPMTLMNRLFGDWASRPFATREHVHKGLTALPFAEVLRLFADRLYDVRTGRGDLVLFTPTRMEHTGTLSVLAIGEHSSAAHDRVDAVLASRLGPAVDKLSA